MKRRTFITGLGFLTAISVSLSAAAASFTESVSIGADFRVFEERSAIESSVVANPDSADVISEHVWEFSDVHFWGEVDVITAAYPDGTSFDGLTNDDVTVEITRDGESEPTEIDVNSDEYSGSEATFDLSGNFNTDVDGPVTVTIDGIENPPAGEYTPTLTFDGDDDTETFTEDLEIADEAAFFDVSITDAPSTVAPGDDVSVTYEVTNTGDAPGDQSVTIEVNGEPEDVRSLELDPGDGHTDVFTYDTAETDDPEITIEVTSDDTTDDRTIAVVGVWELTVDPAEADADAVHTWEASYVEFDGEVDEITVDYPDGASFDGLTNEDITVGITRDGESEPTDIRVNSDEYSGSGATFDLSGWYNTDIDGRVFVTIDGLENPHEGEYTAEITLEGEDDLVTFDARFEV